MAKDSELQKHTLNLFEGDYEKLQALFPDVGAGPVIRKIVREFVERTETTTKLPKSEVNI